MSNESREPVDTTADEADDAVVARLRAADPAARADGPDLTALRAAVDARVRGDQGAGAATTAAPEPTAEPADELSRVRARRWASWPSRAAAVAAVALVVGGGGGYAIGAAGGDGSTSLPPITLGGPGRAEGAAAMDAAGGSPLAAAEDRAGIMPYESGRTVFTSSGLSTEGGTGQAYALDPRAAYSADTAAAAAAVLGVSGEPREVDWGWVVGPDDGTAPTLTLGKDGMIGLQYWDPAKDPWGCVATGSASAEGQARVDEAQPAAPEGAGEQGVEGAEPGAANGPDASVGSDASTEPGTTAEPDAATSDMAILPEPVDCEERDLGPAPKGDAAVAVLRDAMASLGVDVGDYEFRAEDYDDEAYTYVTADHVVGGQRTGLQWGGSLTGAGLQSLHGFTAPLVELGEYAVVSPAEAVERLSDPRFTSGWGGPIAWVDGKDPYTRLEVQGTTASPELPAPVEPGSRIAWRVDEVTIVEARLGVAFHTAADGAALLVPTYELIGEDGAIWSVIAVTDDHLDFEG